MLAPLLVAAALLVPPSAGPTIAFADRMHGFAAGAGGIFGTTDAGRSWRRASRMSAESLVAVDARHAWAIGTQGLLLRTTDGRSWHVLGVPHLSLVGFTDARHGYAIDRDGLLLVTRDGGKSWPLIATPGPVRAACFVDARHGWISRGGAVWRTINAGRTWSRKNLVRTRQGLPLPELGCRGTDAWAVFHEGAAAGTEAYEVFRSLDRGSTWKRVLASPLLGGAPPISNYAGPFTVLGHRSAVFVGDCSPCGGVGGVGTTTVVSTLDGRTFARRTVLRGYPLADASFVDARRGWLVTGTHVASASAVRAGLVWRTTNGGRTWRLVFRSPALVAGP